MQTDIACFLPLIFDGQAGTGCLCCLTDHLKESSLGENDTNVCPRGLPYTDRQKFAPVQFVFEKDQCTIRRGSALHPVVANHSLVLWIVSLKKILYAHYSVPVNTCIKRHAIVDCGFDIVIFATYKGWPWKLPLIRIVSLSWLLGAHSSQVIAQSCSTRAPRMMLMIGRRRVYLTRSNTCIVAMHSLLSLIG